MGYNSFADITGLSSFV